MEENMPVEDLNEKIDVFLENRGPDSRNASFDFCYTFLKRKMVNF